ncbi:hypothetical protein PF008_g30419 [Phytophthora fragariae]|uniref:Uncharacterized protein n=1 Tax=Phytophthora fragariae TaxID=53985 RepID=A0A6G0Q5N0_9STRA|nr:hypothetical protein PF008_g30419 [Phytophthora fragariae]
MRRYGVDFVDTTSALVLALLVGPPGSSWCRFEIRGLGFIATLTDCRRGFPTILEKPQ